MLHLRPLIALGLTALLQACTLQPAPVSVVVVNESAYTRQNETVAVSADEVLQRLQLPDTASFVILNPQGGTIPYQFTYDGNIIFRASVPASGKAVYTFQEGSTLPFESEVEGNLVERADTALLAWADDGMPFAAPRAPQGAAGTASGHYLLPRPAEAQPLGIAIDGVEATEAGADSTHAHHSNTATLCLAGLLSPQRADGGTLALVTGGKAIPFGGWKDYEILDNGPLRFTVRLLDNITLPGGKTLSCTRTITHDAGSPMNRVDLRIDGLARTSRLVAALSLNHPAATASAQTGTGLIAATDTALTAAGETVVTYRGCTFPSVPLQSGIARSTAAGQAQAAGQRVWATLEYCPGSTLTYHFGAARNTSIFTSWEQWTAFLARFAATGRTPLRAVLQ